MPLNEKERTFVVNKVGKKFFHKKFQKKDWLDFEIDSPGNIDFSVRDVRCKDDRLGFLLWAEAKRKKHDKREIVKPLIQLILTIEKEHQDEEFVPPNLLGAFDKEKIFFIPYGKAKEFFFEAKTSLSLRINWDKVTPSDYKSELFVKLFNYEEKREILQPHLSEYSFIEDGGEALCRFRDTNFHWGIGETQKIQVSERNFVKVYERWRDTVKKHIDFKFKEMERPDGVLDRDFYFADLLSDERTDTTFRELQEEIRIMLKKDDSSRSYYEVKMPTPEWITQWKSLPGPVNFDDEGKAHKNFWNVYKRPPAKEIWKLLLKHHHLLVPPDVRERKGAFYTPKYWADKSKEYIALELGDDWQKNYYVWDCCAGSGNLLDGLTNELNIYASTIDYADVLIMGYRATPPLVGQERGEELENPKAELSMLESHIFQFDFLNDELLDDEIGGVKSKLPATLQDIIRDPEEQKKLIIYINPPYAQSGNRKQVIGKGEMNKGGVTTDTKVFRDYGDEMGRARKELYAQFLFRIHKEIPHAIIADFSSLTLLQGVDFASFRETFNIKRLRRLFVFPSSVFEKVSDRFSVGFHIWREKGESSSEIFANVYGKDGKFIEKKRYLLEEKPRINSFLGKFNAKAKSIGLFMTDSNDFQNCDHVGFVSQKGLSNWIFKDIDQDNLIPCSVCMAIRLCVKDSEKLQPQWLYNSDQFFFPNSKWERDLKFQADCLIYALFHDKNMISCRASKRTNEWIPFDPFKRRIEDGGIGAREKFSDFMWRFLNKKLDRGQPIDKMYEEAKNIKFYTGTASDDGGPSIMDVLSPEALAVFEAGKELWIYYHEKFIDGDVNASLYDIRIYFQGVRKKTKISRRIDKETGKEIIKTKVTEDMIPITEHVEGRNGTPKFEGYKDRKNRLGKCMAALGKRIADKYIYKYGFLIK